MIYTPSVPSYTPKVFRSHVVPAQDRRVEDHHVHGHDPEDDRIDPLKRNRVCCEASGREEYESKHDQKDVYRNEWPRVDQDSKQPKERGEKESQRRESRHLRINDQLHNPRHDKPQAI
jgi:hypothetical protein